MEYIFTGLTPLNENHKPSILNLDSDLYFSRLLPRGPLQYTTRVSPSRKTWSKPSPLRWKWMFRTSPPVVSTATGESTSPWPQRSRPRRRRRFRRPRFHLPRPVHRFELSDALPVDESGQSWHWFRQAGNGDGNESFAPDLSHRPSTGFVHESPRRGGPRC